MVVDFYPSPLRTAAPIPATNKTIQKARSLGNAPRASRFFMQHNIQFHFGRMPQMPRSIRTILCRGIAPTARGRIWAVAAASTADHQKGCGCSYRIRLILLRPLRPPRQRRRRIIFREHRAAQRSGFGIALGRSIAPGTRRDAAVDQKCAPLSRFRAAGPVARIVQIFRRIGRYV